jgi:CheY-like chemotaxis protein
MSTPTDKFQVLIADDEPDVYTITQLALKGLQYRNKPVVLRATATGKETVQALKSDPSIAVILLDVVMETDSAGLDACRAIRSELGNRFVRILLRTGQPGHAPERKTIDEYDIDGYLPKAELTSTRLYSAVRTALKAWAELVEFSDIEGVLPRLLARLRVARLLDRFGERTVWGAFMLTNGFVTIAILSALAWLTGVPFVFPSLGPTAFLFFVTPTVAPASPRNTICGHLIGMLCGYGALWLTGLQEAGPAMATGVDFPRVLAAALSLSLTGALMVWCKVAHPPAGATTLIVSLGIITKPLYLLLIMVAVSLLTVQAIIINRMAGIKYPLWGPPVPAKW